MEAKSNAKDVHDNNRNPQRIDLTVNPPPGTKRIITLSRIAASAFFPLWKSAGQILRQSSAATSLPSFRQPQRAVSTGTMGRLM